jgi:hypothetical protein
LQAPRRAHSKQLSHQQAQVARRYLDQVTFAHFLAQPFTGAGLGNPGMAA